VQRAAFLARVDSAPQSLRVIGIAGMSDHLSLPQWWRNEMSEPDAASVVAWTGTPVRPHLAARDNGAEALPWGGRRDRLPLRWPFRAAVQGYRAKALANQDYDPPRPSCGGR
jgi:hypothetical protein